MRCNSWQFCEITATHQVIQTWANNLICGSAWKQNKTKITSGHSWGFESCFYGNKVRCGCSCLELSLSMYSCISLSVSGETQTGPIWHASKTPQLVLPKRTGILNPSESCGCPHRSLSLSWHLYEKNTIRISSQKLFFLRTACAE